MQCSPLQSCLPLYPRVPQPHPFLPTSLKPRFRRTRIITLSTASSPALARPTLSRSVQSPQIDMARVENGLSERAATPYEQALDALSSLITKRRRADKANKGDAFDLLFDYLKILDLEEAIEKMNVIHVAGTKGKGSTCTFTESILRNCGFRTGLFTSPHLIDVRERFRLDGVDISEEKFLTYFWGCFNRLKDNTNQDVPMPTYFHFLALLAFKIFAAEQVDVAILEVGLGGKFDATNVVQKPVVCGISSLGYDHMEILGNTLGEISGEKAGILKHGVPAFTSPQPDEAMSALEGKASELDVNLQVAQPLEKSAMKGQTLALEGEHQNLNAGLAVALASTWLQRTGHFGISGPCTMASLPDQFIKALATASLQGRAQIVYDQLIESESHGDLVFYLDGAHSGESMDACAKWFSFAVKRDSSTDVESLSIDCSHSLAHEAGRHNEESGKDCQQILLFNCMSVRDPLLLLPCLRSTCASYGIHFKKALFVPNTSVYHKVGTHVLAASDAQVDLSWQFTLQRVWEGLLRNGGGDANNMDILSEDVTDETGLSARNCEHSAVFSCLQLAIKWLRDSVQQKKSVRFQVLVTGSLHLVGDVLQLIRK